MKSFRARIIFWTLSISGLVLFVFAAVSSLAFERLRRGEVDEMLRTALRSRVPPPQQIRFWERHGEASQRELERRLGSQSALFVYANAEPDYAGGERLNWGDSEAIFGEGARLPEVEGEMDPDWRTREDALRSPPPGRPFGPRVRGSFPFWNRGQDGPGPDSLRTPEVEIFDFESEFTDSSWRVACARYPGYNIVLGVDLAPVLKNVRQARRSLLIGLPIALGVMGLGIWFFATRAIEPIRRLSMAASRVSARSLDARLDKAGADREFAELIEVFNSMLERLQKSFSQATRFSADAAHELKTPLTVLQGQIETALQEAPLGSEQQKLLANLGEEAHRLKSITRKLLMLSQADAGRLPLRLEEVDLALLAQEALEHVSETASDANFRADLESGEVRLECDRSLTFQILVNLLSNAIKYREPIASEISIRLGIDGAMAFFQIENESAEVTPEERGKLFHRFTRGDFSRNRRNEGTGLGLSLALEFARAQGGDLQLVDTGDACRMRFRLTLPVSRSR